MDERICKHCGKPIVWSHTMNGARYGWFHIDSRVMLCYPGNPKAEPIRES